MARSLRSAAEDILEKADITISGDCPWDIDVHDEHMFHRVFKYGSLGLGESYIDGLWDCPELDQFFYRVMSKNIDTTIYPFVLRLQKIKTRRSGPRSKDNPLKIAETHYDIGNFLYRKILDKRMIYSCAYWKNADNLDAAQEHKLDLCCRKLGLKPGMKILDLGCGWGGLAEYATSHYGVDVVAITTSEEQITLAKTQYTDSSIDLRLQHYQEVNETFDAIVCLEMFEHVGIEQHIEFMEVIHRCLQPEGLFLLQTIGKNHTEFVQDLWTNKTIIPNGYIPSASQIIQASEKYLVLEDLHALGADYDKTLMAWSRNFEHSWLELAPHYDERFYRLWSYYLKSCAGAFRAHHLRLWQLVFRKAGTNQSYHSIR